MVMINGRNKMLTPTEVARLLHIHINTVRRWSDQGILRPYRIGPRGDRRFDKEHIASFLHNSMFTDTTEKVETSEEAL
jgi:excisionase family DNA binding protein